MMFFGRHGNDVVDSVKEDRDKSEEMRKHPMNKWWW